MVMENLDALMTRPVSRPLINITPGRIKKSHQGVDTNPHDQEEVQVGFLIIFTCCKPF